MPSLAQGYGRGLLLGLQLEEAKRRKQRDELSDEFLKERLEDMRFQRKTLLREQKEQEEEKREAKIKEIHTGHDIGGRGMELSNILAAVSHVTPAQREIAVADFYEREGTMPSYVPGLVSPKVPKKPTWSEQEREGDIQHLMRTQKITRQEAIGILRQKRIYGSPKRGVIDVDALGAELSGAKFTPSGAIVEVPEGIEAPGVLGSLNLPDFGKGEEEEAPEEEVEVDEVANKTNGIALNLLARIKDGEFDRQYIQDYIDENAEEYRTQGVDPDLLKEIIGF